MDLIRAKVINAAGKLTSLGGSAQSQSVAETQAVAAQMHFDMDVLRREVAAEIANYCGAEAACVTSGAAAGLTIGVAAMLCRHDPALASQLPRLQEPQSVVIQAGHNINFGADIEQMVQDAEANREEDAKRREMIDLKNEADQAIYNTEKQLQEHKEKIPQNIHDQINGDITSLNEAVTTEDPEKIKEALERLKNSQMEIGKSIYAQGNTESTEEQP